MTVPAAVRFCSVAGGGGGAAEIVKVCKADVPPPGVGLNTVTCTLPAAATSAAGMAAVSCVALTNVVVRSAPFQRTVEPVTKLAPLTVRVKAAAPVAAPVGASVAKAGTGLLAGGGGGVAVPPPYTSNSATEMNAAVPPGAP